MAERVLQMRNNVTYRGGKVHGGGNQDLAGRDLEAVDGTRNSGHLAELDLRVGFEDGNEWNAAAIDRKTNFKNLQRGW